MKNIVGQLKQNKGASLVEVLVALGISAIVFIVVGAFITNGTNFFNRQSRTIKLQNELMEVSNKVNDNVMQATAIVLDYNNDGNHGEGFSLYTGEVDFENKVFLTGTKGSTAKLIQWGGMNNKDLYVLDDLTLTTAEDKAPFQVGYMVSNVLISISDECVDDPNNGTYYKQPLVLEIKITVSDGKSMKSDSKVVRLRNEIDKLIIDGVVYENDGSVLRLVEPQD